MTNFSSSEFHKLGNRLSSDIMSRFNVGRGRRCRYSGKDMLFMALATAKHGGNWDFLGSMFGIKGPAFERIVTNFVKMFAGTVYRTLVLHTGNCWSMKRLIDDDNTFKTFKFARYATDVTFQQTNRPSGNHQESKKYFSGKHKLYGYKIEVSVLANGLAIGCTDHYPGSVSHLDIFYKNLCFHKTKLEKSTEEKTIVDISDLVDKYRDEWAVIMDKGYQGAEEVARAVHPKKKPRNGFLTVEEEIRNKKISSDSIIAENFFGRHCTLWGVMSEKYRWAEDFYDYLFCFCMGLTNVHISLYLLRQEDHDSYQRLKNKLYSIGEEVVVKRNKRQESYRATRKRRLQNEFKDWVDSDEETIML